MKIFIDTNVLLDVLYKRPKFYQDALAIFHACEARQIEGFISVLSIPNIVYVMRKELERSHVQNLIDIIMQTFHVKDLTAEQVRKAASKAQDDYEDAVQEIVAIECGAEYLITRNEKDFLGGDAIRIISPRDFVRTVLR